MGVLPYQDPPPEPPGEAFAPGKYPPRPPPIAIKVVNAPGPDMDEGVPLVLTPFGGPAPKPPDPIVIVYFPALKLTLLFVKYPPAPPPPPVVSLKLEAPVYAPPAPPPATII